MQRRATGFTLIELSIVLVIIGLIVGSVLVGQELIASATVRAEISQIGKYQQAVNSFRGKYGYLPGDIKDPDASNFGFQARGAYSGEGDGNGVIEGISSNAPSSTSGFYVGSGEEAMFWVDLGVANLIPEHFNMATPTSINYASPMVNAFFPQGKFPNSYVTAWSGNPGSATPAVTTDRGSVNFFSVQGILGFHNASQAYSIDSLTSGGGISIRDAYAMDSKIDDGLPQSGRVLAVFVTAPSAVWAQWVNGCSGYCLRATPSTGAEPADSRSCFDNGGIVNTVSHYSIATNYTSNPVCGVSFQFN